MEKRGIKPGSPESKLAGKRILTQLTEVTPNPNRSPKP